MSDNDGWTFDITTATHYGESLVSKERKRKADAARIREIETLQKKLRREAEASSFASSAGSPVSSDWSAAASPIDLHLDRSYSLLPKRNKGGRPRTKEVVKYRQLKGNTILRKNHPVLARIPLDVWQRVFSFCPLDFLFKTRKTCSGFRAALSYESAWKECRISNYGTDHPQPPPGFNEMQYADLLSGIGCQGKGCGDKKARKTYWAFQRRWCDKCLKSKTITVWPEPLGCLYILLIDISCRKPVCSSLSRNLV